MKNPRRILSVGLAAATFVVVLPFFAGGVLILQPELASLVLQAGLSPGSGPAWFGPVAAFSAVGMSVAAFVISRKEKSFLAAGLLAACGAFFMIPALIATGFLAVIVIPGPIFGVIIGLGIIGLGIAKGIRTARAEMVAVAE
jgi:hypothetical protein